MHSFRDKGTTSSQVLGDVLQGREMMMETPTVDVGVVVVVVVVGEGGRRGGGGGGERIG